MSQRNRWKNSYSQSLGELEKTLVSNFYAGANIFAQINRPDVSPAVKLARDMLSRRIKDSKQDTAIHAKGKHTAPISPRLSTALQKAQASQIKNTELDFFQVIIMDGRDYTTHTSNASRASSYIHFYDGHTWIPAKISSIFQRSGVENEYYLAVSRRKKADGVSVDPWPCLDQYGYYGVEIWSKQFHEEYDIIPCSIPICHSIWKHWKHASNAVVTKALDRVSGIIFCGYDYNTDIQGLQNFDTL